MNIFAVNVGIFKPVRFPVEFVSKLNKFLKIIL